MEPVRIASRTAVTAVEPLAFTGQPIGQKPQFTQPGRPR